MVPRNSILLVAPTAYKLGGLASWLDYILPGLVDQQWDVTLGLVSGPRHHQPKQYLKVHPFAKTLTIHCQCSTQYGRILAVRKAIQQVKPQIVLTVNIPDAITATAIERSAGRDVRAIMTCHGIQEDLFADMRHLNQQLDAVVCTNQLACRLAAITSQLPQERIFHCAYGTAVTSQLPSKQKNEILTIGYSGRLEQPQKRIHDLVSIAAQLRDSGQPFRFLIAGSGPEEDRLKSSLKARDLLDHFCFLGFVPPEGVNEKLYKAADVLVVTSAWETGPIVIWEAMAAGTPVVTSHYTGSGLERLLWHQQNCLMFEIGDTSGAAATIKALSNDPRLYERIQNAAFATVTEKLSYAVSVKNWNAILNQLAARAPVKQKTSPPSGQTDGRLSRLLAPSVATFLRKLFGRLPPDNGPDNGPGSEWPHTITGATKDADQFFDMAARLDQRQDEAEMSVS